jgi:hypothetical protein
MLRTRYLVVIYGTNDVNELEDERLLEGIII